MGQIEALKSKSEDIAFLNGEAMQTAQKEVKEWKDKFFKIQEYVHALTQERISRTVQLEQALKKVIELEAIIGKFASIQEQLLSSKNKRREVVDVDRVITIFSQMQEDHRKEESLKQKSMTATVTPDRRFVHIVIQTNQQAAEG